MQGQINDCRYNWFLTNTSARFYTALDRVAQSRIEFNAVNIPADGSVSLSYTPENLDNESVIIGGPSTFTRVRTDGFVQFSVLVGATRQFRNFLDAGSDVQVNQQNTITLSRTGDVFTLAVNGVSRTWTIAGAAFSISEIGRRSDSVIQFGSGYVYNVTVTSAGSELLNMPIDQNYTPANNTVLNLANPANNGIFVNVADGDSTQTPPFV